MTYEELVKEAKKLGVRVTSAKGPAINPETYLDRPVSKIVATALAASGLQVSNELANATGIKTKGVFFNKLSRNSFSVEQLASILEFCGGTLMAAYADGTVEALEFNKGKENK